MIREGYCKICGCKTSIEGRGKMPKVCKLHQKELIKLSREKTKRGNKKPKKIRACKKSREKIVCYKGSTEFQGNMFDAIYCCNLP